jgi:hypothetical protein
MARREFFPDECELFPSVLARNETTVVPALLASR